LFREEEVLIELGFARNLVGIACVLKGGGGVTLGTRPLANQEGLGDKLGWKYTNINGMYGICNY